MIKYRIQFVISVSPDIVEAEDYELDGVWIRFHTYNGTTIAVYSAYNIRSVEVISTTHESMYTDVEN